MKPDQKRIIENCLMSIKRDSSDLYSHLIDKHYAAAMADCISIEHEIKESLEILNQKMT